MDGLYIKTKQSCIETVKQKAATLSLLARGNQTEVMLHEVDAGKLFTVYPGESETDMEFFYIITGSISYEEDNEETVLKQGDYFYVRNLKETVVFNTIEKTTFFYVSAQPIFQFMSTELKELHNIVARVEEKDIYTHHHGKRVKEFSLKLAKNLNFTGEKLEKLGWAALFHDIGKVNIPDKILNKPGPLTDKEYSIIKNHPTEGKIIVENTFLANIGKIIEQHHENLDGTGYPNGLKFDEILDEAQIIRIIDSYDAMTSDRPYRKGMTQNRAIQELEKLKNIHYDKKIVDKFIEILPELDFT